MATITTGHNAPSGFVSGETVTPAKLNAHINSATVSGIVNADVDASAAIAHSKLANITAGQVLLGNASNVPTATALTGDVTVTSSGVTAIGNAKVTAPMLTGAQTGSAPIYGCRAWVNINGLFTSVTGNSYSRTGTTVTVTKTSHGLSTGNRISVSSATDTGLNTTANTASAQITVVDANTFTFQTASTGTASGTLTYALGIRAEGNVASVLKNGTGDYTITFSTALPDANYVDVFGGRRSGAGFVSQALKTEAGTKTSTSFRIHTSGSLSGAEAVDHEEVCVALFR